MILDDCSTEKTLFFLLTANSKFFAKIEFIESDFSNNIAITLIELTTDYFNSFIYN